MIAPPSAFQMLAHGGALRPPSTIYGISDNPNAFYINPPDAEFGWAPAHSSLELGAPDPRDPLDPADPRNRVTGGIFAEWGHSDDSA